MAPPAPTNNFPSYATNSFNSKKTAIHFKKMWNFHHKHIMTYRTREKYKIYNSLCLVFKSVQNTKLALSCVRY